jgi:hypothetical protein
MIRKLLLPALFVGLLGGCVTDYGYRDGYYYGQPRVEYRYHDYGYPNGYYPYGYYPYGYTYPYGQHYYRYNYYYPNYRYGYPYYSPNYRKPRPPVTGTTPPPSRPRPGTHDRDDDLPPWRDYTRRRRTDGTSDGPRAQTPIPNQPVIRQPPRREVRDTDDSRAARHERREERRRRLSGEEP